jgi:transposase
MVATRSEAQELLLAQQGQLATLQAQVKELCQQLAVARQTIARQQYQLDQYVARLYGRRSEQLDPNQLRFDALLIAATASGATASSEEAGNDPEGLPPPPAAARRTPRKPHGRLPIPDHLERVVIELDVPEAERRCPVTGRPLVLIGYEDTERLEYQPGRVFVRVYRRPKYASPERRLAHEVGVITPPLPDHPIDKCKADPGLISYAIVSKYADHLPLYRQDQIFRREGIELPRATLDGWLLQSGDAMLPLGQALQAAVLDTDVLFTDDTVMPLQENGRGRTRQARMWVYLRGGCGPPLVAYDFTADRSQKRPLEYLGDYQGYVHADAYSGYDVLFRRDGITEVGCWAHARRRFHEVLPHHPQEASHVLALIGRMYAEEKHLRPLSPADRQAGRQETVRPLVDTILQQVDAIAAQALPREPLAQACRYVQNQRQALQTFLLDGRLEPDNNRAENAIRPIAVGRKNYLFVGSPRGGRIAALYLGLIESCKQCQVNPWAYFDDILRRIMSHPVHQLRELLPDRWKPAPRDDRGLIITV